jgi:uncharacterized membrane protein YeaQ/YmgE (transglycosylase-associated protein family)
MLAGGALGWLGYTFLGFNEGRGKTVSIIIGIVGGFFGGKIVAPMFTAAAAAPGDFSVSALFIAAAVAAAFLAVGNLVYSRWGV